MPREWRFIAPSAAWRRRWATADPSRLLADAARAFVDRAPIDWTALRARLSHPRDRAIVEHLQELDLVRHASAPPGGGGWTRAATLARLIVGLSALHILAALVAVAAALWAGRTHERLTSQLALLAAYVSSSFVLGATASRDPRRLFLLAALLCTASAFARGAATGTLEPGSPAGVLLRNAWFEVFTPGCMWLFALDFPRVPRFTIFDRIGRGMTAAAWILGLTAFVVNAAIAVFQLDERSFAAVLPSHPSNLFWRIFTILDILAVGAIVARARRAPSLERRRVWRFALALAICMAPFLLLGLARTLVPSLDAWMIGASAADRRWLDTLVVAALAAAPILTTLAVVVDRPFDLYAVVRRRGFGVARSTRRVLKEQKQLARDVARIRRGRSVEEVAAALTQGIRCNLSGATGCVLSRDTDGAYRDRAGDVALSTDSALYAILSASAEPIVVNDRLTMLLPDVDREWVTVHGVDLAAPIVAPDGSLAAIAIAGSRTRRRPARDADQWTFATLVAAASSVWEVDLVGDSLAQECPRCGAIGDDRAQACGCGAGRVTAALPAIVAGKFMLRRRIGSGSAGIVYLARDIRLPRDVALKTLPHVRPDAMNRLRDEAGAMAALSHEGLATLYGLEVWNHTPVLVVEYFPKGTLADRLRPGPLPATVVAIVGIRLTSALEYMHDRDVLHRDLKPSNIGMTTAGAPKLLDFGLAALPGSARATRLAGTLGYMPPEAFEGVPADRGFDLWALAIVLAQALTGAGPGEVDDTRRAIRASASEFATFFDRALARAPTDRYLSAREMRAALEAVLARLGGSRPDS
jgi:hypothetical protein